MPDYFATKFCFLNFIDDHLYEGRFTPRVNDKRISKNVYAKTREECEEKLAELTKTMKTLNEEQVFMLQDVATFYQNVGLSHCKIKGSVV